MPHFGDPCIHCGIAHDNVPPGLCQGDPEKARPIAYVSLGVRWDNVEHYRIRFSDGSIRDRWEHISFQLPYWQFGYSQQFGDRLQYDERLKQERPHAG